MGIFRRPRTPAQAFSLAAVVLAAALAIFLGYGAWQLSRTVAAVSSDPFRDLTFPLPLSPSADVSERRPGLAGAFARGDRVNLLLLGYGGPGHDGAYLTDTVIFASLDALANVVTLVSIPRDVWVTIPKSKYSESYQAKINEAFAVGGNRNDRDEGLRLASAVVADMLSVAIDRAIAIDFRAFRTVVDRLGGIDVTVDRAFGSPYPTDDESWIDIFFKAGPQHMDSETALRYSRARYADGPEGSDFARSARQLKVILAAKDKVVATGATQTLLGLLDALRENVRTDLSLADMRTLGDFGKSYDDASTIRGGITNQNVLQNYLIQFSDGAGFTLQPRVDGWSEVRAYVRRLLDHPGSLREDATVTVRVARRRGGVGDEVVERLGDLGYRAKLELVDTDDPATTLVTGGASETVAALASYFRVERSDAFGAVVVHLGLDWKPPPPFALRLQFLPAAPAVRTPPPTLPVPPLTSPSVRPAPSASPSPSPSPRSSPSPTRVPAATDR